MPGADEYLDIVEPDVRRGFSGMFTRMRRKQLNTAQAAVVNGMKPIVIKGGTQVNPSAGGDKYLLYTQGAAATVWTITHNFGRYPNVMLMDNAGAQMDALIEHTDLNELTITFNTAQDGQAALN